MSGFSVIFFPGEGSLSLLSDSIGEGGRRRRRKVKVNLSSPLFPNGLMGEGGEGTKEGPRAIDLGGKFAV